MKKEQIIIPKPMQLCLDDIGWFFGADQRESQLPSRTGIHRRHVLEDYQIVEEIGKGLNQKINCMLVIGEWDRKKLLAKIPYSNKYGAAWEGSEYYDDVEAHKIFEYLNASNFIELGWHGLLHDSWNDEGILMGTELSIPEGCKRGNPVCLPSDDYMRIHFDAWFEIYNDWGFKSPIRAFASPCGARNNLVDGRMTRMLKEYNFQFWQNGTGPAKYRPYWNDILENGTVVQNGIICNMKNKSMGPWEIYDMDPEIMEPLTYEKLGINGGHWVNFLRFNPKKNMENLEGWIRYWDNHGEMFGCIISRDIAFAHYQKLYVHTAKVEEKDGGIVIDFTESDKLLDEANLPAGKRPDLFISIKKGEKMPVCEGGTISEYETRRDFINYKITRTTSSVITLK